MARKRMVSVRLAPAVADQLDARAAAAGQTRTEWIAGTLARAVLTGAGTPQPVHEPGDGAGGADASGSASGRRVGRLPTPSP